MPAKSRKTRVARAKPPARMSKAEQARQEKERQAQRQQSARKAALARWSGERPISQKERKRQLALRPTAELTVEDYADRANPELSWAAAILKRRASTEEQRQKAAEIMSRGGEPSSSQQLVSFWQKMSPQERTELARQGGKRRWEIWREEQQALHGKHKSQQERKR